MNQVLTKTPVYRANAQGGYYPNLRKRKKYQSLFYDHQSSLQNLQLNGKTHNGQRYQPVHYDMSTEQRRLLNHALYGLKRVSKTQLERMDFFERMNVLQLHHKAQQVIHQYKEALVENTIRNWIGFFTKKGLGYMLHNPEILPEKKDEEHIMMATMSHLYIRKEQVAEWLTAAGVLPENFFEL